MATYHVGCGVFGIYAGTLNKKGDLWQNKTEVTDEAICAVRDWLYNEFINAEKHGGGYEWKTKDGKTVSLIIKVEAAKDENA